MNTIDLSPNYAGELSAFGNGFGSIAGFLAPYAIGLLTPNVCSFLYVSGDFNSIVFLLVCRILCLNGE